MQLVAMVVTVGVVCSCEVDGVLCVHPMRGNPCIGESEGVANSVQQDDTSFGHCDREGSPMLTAQVISTSTDAVGRHGSHCWSRV